MDAVLIPPKQENFHLSRDTLESLPYQDKIIKKFVNKIEQEQLIKINEDTLGVLFEKLIREQVKRYILEQQGKDIFEYDIFNCPEELKGQLKIGDFSA